MRNRFASQILVVGSDGGVRSGVVRALGGAYRWLECASGSEAHARVRRERIDVVISDRDLEDMAGLALLGLLRGSGHRPAVILLSAGASGGWVRHAFRQGAFDVLPEPYDAAEVRGVVEQALQRREWEGIPSPVEGVKERQTDAAEDVLLGLPVSGALAGWLERFRTECRRHGRRASFLVFNIDGFRGVNEGHSREAGDALLRWFGVELTRHFDSADPIGRCAGDRFVAAVQDADEDRATAHAERFRVALSSVGRECPLGDCRPRVRIGVAASGPGFDETVEDLMERAEAAAARAKELGGNQTMRWSRLSTSGPSRRRLEGVSASEVSGWISRSRQQLRRGYLESTLALVAAVEAKDPLTRGHARAVSRYCEEIGRRMKLSTGQLESLRTSALLHDVGKIGVPDAILQKPGPLTVEEFAVVQRHPQTAQEILGHASFLQDELPCILHHHERFEGGGYPSGLRGTEIPLAARILTVADSLDAMLSSRCYKRGMSLGQVKSELVRCSGGQFDPEIARVGLDWLESEPDAVRGS